MDAPRSRPCKPMYVRDTPLHDEPCKHSYYMPTCLPSYIPLYLHMSLIYVLADDYTCACMTALTHTHTLAHNNACIHAYIQTDTEGKTYTHSLIHTLEPANIRPILNFLEADTIEVFGYLAMPLQYVPPRRGFNDAPVTFAKSSAVPFALT